MAREMTPEEKEDFDKMIKDLCEVSRESRMEGIKMQNEAEKAAAQYVFNC